jgi:4-hydroxy-tetrahydrodipicolinate synthase
MPITANCLWFWVGGNNTAEVLEELQNRDLSKFAAVLSVSPYYNKPTQEGFTSTLKPLRSPRRFL